MAIARAAHELGLYCDCDECKAERGTPTAARRAPRSESAVSSAYWRDRCAICNPNYHGSRLCEPCRRDPANDGWGTAEDEVPVEDLGGAIALPRSLVEAQQDTPIRGSTTLQTLILTLLFAGDREKVQRKRADTGGTVSTYYRRKPLSYRAIAKRAGCSDRLVRRVAKRFIFGGED